MTATVSVVMPTYNGRAFVREALDSVFSQTALPQDVIVVDDASRDGTVDIVAEMARCAPVPVQLIRLRKNSGGPAVPLNAGVAASNQELIAVLDQDDVYLPNKLQEQVRLLGRHREMTFAFGLTGYGRDPNTPMQAAGEIQELRESSQEEEGYQILVGADALRLLLRRGNYVWGYPGFVFRRTDWQQKGGADERFVIASDYDLLCHLCTRGSVGFIPRIHYLRRRHDANMTNRTTEAHLEVARIKTRYLMQERWLLDDTEFSDTLLEEFLTLAFWVKEANHFREALECYRLLHRIWGWQRKGLWEMIKLFPQWVYRTVTRRPPIYSVWTAPSESPYLHPQTISGR